MMMKSFNKNKILIVFFIFLFFFLAIPVKAYATIPSIDVSLSTTDDPAQMATSVQLLFIIAIIGLAPTLLMMVTCFPRILISFHFVRAAMGTQQMPPNQILIALALFLTFAFMGDIFVDINENALKPLSNGEITQEAAFERGMQPLREFMIRNASDEDLLLFWGLSGREEFTISDEMPNHILIPAFLLGEIKKGFEFGAFVYIPFIVIDMVVASILMAMGMMMLPPAMISTPFKILLFVSIGGWNYTIESIMAGFR